MPEKPPTTQLVPVKDILEQLILLKDGSVRSVLDVSAINFELRSSDEQMALIQQFQNFLNSIDFPIQILVQSRKYNIEQYLKIIEEAAAALDNAMLAVQAEEYMRFVRELSDLANIMTKKFFVVIPLEVVAQKKSAGIMKDISGMFSRKKKAAAPEDSGPSPEQLRAWKEQLAQRSGLVSAGLQGMGLTSKLLEQQDLLALLTALYNPEVPVTAQA